MMTQHFAPKFALTFGLLVAIMATLAHADEATVKLSTSPEAVRKTFIDEAKPTKIDMVNKSTDEGVTTYWVKTVIGNRHFEIHVDGDGTLISMELDVPDDEIKFADCPAAVKATLAKESNNAKFEEVGKGIKYGVTVYDAAAQVGGKEYSYVVTESGTLVEKMLVIIEDEVELSHCPAPVQQALKDHSAGGKVVNILRSTGLGGHVYEVDVEIGTKTYIIDISEGGALLSKTLLDEDADVEMPEKSPKPAEKK